MLSIYFQNLKQRLVNMTEIVHNKTGFNSGMISVIFLHIENIWIQQPAYCQDRMTI